MLQCAALRFVVVTPQWMTKKQKKDQPKRYHARLEFSVESQ